MSLIIHPEVKTNVKENFVIEKIEEISNEEFNSISVSPTSSISSSSLKNFLEVDNMKETDLNSFSSSSSKSMNRFSLTFKNSKMEKLYTEECIKGMIKKGCALIPSSILIMILMIPVTGLTFDWQIRPMFYFVFTAVCYFVSFVIISVIGVVFCIVSRKRKSFRILKIVIFVLELVVIVRDCCFSVGSWVFDYHDFTMIIGLTRIVKIGTFCLTRVKFHPLFIVIHLIDDLIRIVMWTIHFEQPDKVIYCEFEAVSSVLFYVILYLTLRNLEMKTRLKFWNQFVSKKKTEDIRKEKEISDILLENVLPPIFISHVDLDSSLKYYQYFENIGCLRTDFINFTKNVSNNMEVEKLFNLLTMFFSAFDSCCDEYGLLRVKLLGDGYQLISDPTQEGRHSCIRIVLVGCKMYERLEEIKNELRIENESLMMRIGGSFGSVCIAVLGNSLLSFDCFGEVVRECEELEESGEHGMVHINEKMFEQIPRSEFYRFLFLEKDGNYLVKIRFSSHNSYKYEIPEDDDASDGCSTIMGNTATILTSEYIGSDEDPNRVENEEEIVVKNEFDNSVLKRMNEGEENSRIWFTRTIEMFLGYFFDRKLRKELRASNNSTPYQAVMIVYTLLMQLITIAVSVQRTVGEKDGFELKIWILGVLCLISLLLLLSNVILLFLKKFLNRVVLVLVMSFVNYLMKYSFILVLQFFDYHHYLIFKSLVLSQILGELLVDPIVPAWFRLIVSAGVTVVNFGVFFGFYQEFKLNIFQAILSHALPLSLCFSVFSYGMLIQTTSMEVILKNSEILRQYSTLCRQRDHSIRLFRSVLPIEVLKNQDCSVENVLKMSYAEKKYASVCFVEFSTFYVIFDDFPRIAIFRLNTLLSIFDNSLEQYEIKKVKSIQNSYLCYSDKVDIGMRKKNIVLFGLNCIELSKKLSGISIRIGISDGEVMVGLLKSIPNHSVGLKINQIRFSLDIFSHVCCEAHRLMKSSLDNHIHVLKKFVFEESEEIFEKDKVFGRRKKSCGSDFRYIERGRQILKGIGERITFVVLSK